jgi:hypothetical protein
MCAGDLANMCYNPGSNKPQNILYNYCSVVRPPDYWSRDVISLISGLGALIKLIKPYINY